MAINLGDNAEFNGDDLINKFLAFNFGIYAGIYDSALEKFNN